MIKTKPRLLILSAVYPFPRTTGQQQRVYYKLRSLRADFHLTFLTVAAANEVVRVRAELLKLCDAAIVLPSEYSRTFVARGYHKISGTAYAWCVGLKFSNYLIGEVEFSPERVASALGEMSFAAVLFEYWHAYRAAALFRERGIRGILDMHDILWKSFAKQLDDNTWIPRRFKQWLVDRYRAREETAWNAFDVLIAINQDEREYVRRHTRDGITALYVPMGTDLEVWPYCWEPASPRRIAFYGSLGSRHNQKDALASYRDVMPAIWKRFPDIQYWIVGSNPPSSVRGLDRDGRVHVTGFVENPQEVLRAMTIVICPWSGTYGFRSRVVEAMALGVPVIASQDAVKGMGLEEGRGILCGGSSPELADLALRLLGDDDELHRQSLQARIQIEQRFSYESTYLRFSTELAQMLDGHP